MSLIRKVKQGNKRELFIGSFKILSYQKKAKVHDFFVPRKDIFEELKKYAPVSPPPAYPETTQYKNVIWQLWFQGDRDLPLIVKKCLDSVRSFAEDHTVILLTEENLDQFIQIPAHIKEKYNQGIITRTHLSDYIRLMLLAQYGGTWIDATCLLTQNIPSQIYHSEFFIFRAQPWMNMNRTPDGHFFDFIQPSYGACFHAGSSWFMHARENCPIILDTLAMLNNYWESNNQLLDYFLLHYFLTHAIISSAQNREIFDRMPAYSNIPPHLMQSYFFKPYDASGLEGIKQNSFIHKLTYKGLDKQPIGGTFLSHLLDAETR